MLSIFNRKTEVKGKIGYFKLQDWWLSEFSQDERDHIEQVFHPMGFDPNSKSLTQGDLTGFSKTATWFLWTLSGWFNNPRDRQIAKKIIEKAYELAPQEGTVLDKHFTLDQKREIFYRERVSNPEALAIAVHACKEQIELAPEAAAAFLKEYPLQALPAHGGYRQLRIILEKQGRYDDAIRLCVQAKQQGWADDWNKLIETLKKKKANTATKS